jgi:putative ABC transport system ATP-binding protein
VIHVRNVVKHYLMGRVTVEALRGVSLSVRRGEFVCVAGPSGSGKSTLLNIIGCIDRPTSGAVEIDQTLVSSLSSYRLARFRRDHIGFIFQNFNLLPVLSVAENVEFPLAIAGRLDREGRRRAMELIELVGLGPYARHRPDELSGGQRQRVAIARALVTQPRIILADEPTASLDSETSRQIMELMARLNREQGVTFLFSTHDESVMKRASRLVVVRDGRIHSDTAAPSDRTAAQVAGS